MKAILLPVKETIAKLMSNKDQLVIIVALFIFQFLINAIYVNYRPGFQKVKNITSLNADLKSIVLSGFEQLNNRLDKAELKQDSINKNNEITMQHIPRIFPVPGARISSNYGMRDSVMHWGIDMSAPIGTPIYASASGKVIETKFDDGYGNCTIIDSGNGIIMKYGHQDSMFVSLNQEVKQGQKIGTVGNTGNSSGSHTHIEIVQDDKHINPIIFYR